VWNAARGKLPGKRQILIRAGAEAATKPKVRWLLNSQPHLRNTPVDIYSEGAAIRYGDSAAPSGNRPPLICCRFGRRFFRPQDPEEQSKELEVSQKDA
jgi:hypothetical protein